MEVSLRALLHALPEAMGADSQKTGIRIEQWTNCMAWHGQLQMCMACSLLKVSTV